MRSLPSDLGSHLLKEVAQGLFVANLSEDLLLGQGKLLTLPVFLHFIERFAPTARKAAC